MTPEGTRLLVIPAHRAYAAAMTEDEPLTEEQSERLKAVPREMDARMGHAVHYGPGRGPPLRGRTRERALERRARGRCWM